MVKFNLVFLSIASLFVIGLLSTSNLIAQDFPYSVPQAPEFDAQGNHAEPAPSDSYRPRKRSKHRPEYTEPDNETDLRTVRPYVPNGPTSAVAPPQPRAEVPPAGYAARSTPAPPNYPQSPAYPPQSVSPPPQPASPPPQQPVSAPQGTPDCSRYPIMIQYARSEAEMKAAAQMFLTCLMKMGMPLEEARQYVIRTIETTYSAAR